MNGKEGFRFWYLGTGFRVQDFEVRAGVAPSTQHPAPVYHPLFFTGILVSRRPFG